MNLHIHEVSRVSVETEELHLDNGDGYTVNRIVVHSGDHKGNPIEFKLTLYGLRSLQGAMSIPFDFSKVEERV